MDEDDLFVGGMDIDEGAAGGGGSAAVAAGARGGRALGVDEDMSEVAEIMLNLKVCTAPVFPVSRPDVHADIFIPVLTRFPSLRDRRQSVVCIPVLTHFSVSERQVPECWLHAR